MIRTLKQLKAYASGNHCQVEKRGHIYEWWRDNNHSIVGVCTTIKECADEIYNEVFLPNWNGLGL